MKRARNVGEEIPGNEALSLKRRIRSAQLHCAMETVDSTHSRDRLFVNLPTPKTFDEFVSLLLDDFFCDMRRICRHYGQEEE
jgi:hypothetical protein